MKKLALLLFLSVSIFVFYSPAEAQTISKEKMIWLTPEWEGERFADGRPKVPDDILERMEKVSIEEAWGEEFTLRRYHDQALSYGSPPVKHVRALMLEEPIPD